MKKYLFVIFAMISCAAIANEYYDVGTLPEVTITAHYPRQSAQYYNYDDCAGDNPDNNVVCVLSYDDTVWALAQFPTMTGTNDGVYSSPFAVWAAHGTDVMVHEDYRNNFRVWNGEYTDGLAALSVCMFDCDKYRDSHCYRCLTGDMIPDSLREN